MIRATELFSRNLGKVFNYFYFPIAWATRGRKLVFAIHAGNRDLAGASKVAVFVHHDKRGVVHEYVCYYLQSLRDAGFEILFVSNGRGLGGKAVDSIRMMCTEILCRRNVGYDFGAYRDGLRYLGDLSRFQQVLLINDSVYGPFTDLTELLSRCTERAAIWGVTDSWSGRYHLQSYFLLIGRTALVSHDFARFWSGMVMMHSKQWVIQHYEIGFTQAMIRSGQECAALVPYRAVTRDLINASRSGELSDDALEPTMARFFAGLVWRVESGIPLNPMHQFWDHVIRKSRCPFIKRELIVRNPAKIPHAYLWEAAIASVSSYDTGMITRHVKTVVRNRAP